MLNEVKPRHSYSQYLQPDRYGEQIHEWLKEEFEGVDGLRFEEEVNYRDSDGCLETGRFDAYDGDFVYEFKTKASDWFQSESLPLKEDQEQLQNYLNGLDERYGLLVYIDRESFDIEQYLVDGRSNSTDQGDT